MKAFSATRRGRPKAVRTLSDLGTPELQAVRRVRVAGGDPALAENPLSALLARGLITTEQHQAGCRYEALYRRAVARKEISYDSLYAGLGDAQKAKFDSIGRLRRRDPAVKAAGREIMTPCGNSANLAGVQPCIA